MIIPIREGFVQVWIGKPDKPQSEQYPAEQAHRRVEQYCEKFTGPSQILHISLVSSI